MILGSFRAAGLLGLFAATAVQAAEIFTENITQPEALVAALLPNRTDLSSVSAVWGQQIVTKPFDLTVLSNETHALVTWNVSELVDDIGWLAVGFGTSMTDSSIVIVWPNDNGTEWTLSHRSASGYTQPQVSRGVKETAPFQVVQDLYSSQRFRTTTNKGGLQKFTTVSFIRPLDLPSDQDLFLNDKWLNMSRGDTAQKITYAYSSSRPSSMDNTSNIQQHDAGMFGWESFDMSLAFLNVSSVGNITDTKDGDHGWTHYDTVVIAHASLGMIMWLLIAPGAVLIARLGRAMPNWFKLHSFIQGYIFIPGVFAVAALGMLANYLGYSTDFTAHKFFGFLLLVIVLWQLGSGYWSHKNHDPNATSRPWFNIAHMVVGIFGIVLSWVQIWLGFGEYNGRPRGRTVTIIYGVFIAAFGAIYGSSVLVVVRARRRDGRSWQYAFFGLGNDEASAQKPWVGRMNTWVSNEGSADARAVNVPGARGDLSAWR